MADINLFILDNIQAIEALINDQSVFAYDESFVNGALYENIVFTEHIIAEIKTPVNVSFPKIYIVVPRNKIAEIDKEYLVQNVEPRNRILQVTKPKYGSKNNADTTDN